ncbi:Histone-lysine N-methyltransferase, H3 lysine-79 specific [Fulvia fulva]|uniref:Histone-lysine N-methyltransferase, H3 lysine-79 specific n=1 Tax=Passalora fulva TaxID=5499 RepID=A0A9Q8L9A5_PASFU|nr:Histone-lysine N-methyltransferase, H3 lysine-79 specific [Fulvia fulva]KAK4632015.1 Histone-lysine N-methyltransferase, H3 lysine-79 specific [Fulvia fulva]KAK4633628.1 Histone-lysine N-methyltransferase, H3 lysine-79 specific [Fulvia fulva]UJO13167.1 Histone-lysine N-methyltransferase, H3 lysine-79 specific [Fulvia fulva]WPV11528.1 Histone-lysine N-methyltransferase, H3 lysine-79 specific [Fulvia fulva]WPV26443.1 Histone-lysine N-methyltransferase, H3 lysine-79 specific [Fulvia fulva]
MNFSKPKSATANQPVIRKTTVRVPVKAIPNARPQATRPDPNRFKTALDRPGTKASASNKPQNPARRALSASRGVKRKSATPQPMFSDDEGDDSSDVGGSDSDASRKRIKSSVSSLDDGPRRRVICDKAFQVDTVFDIVHGADATSGNYSSKFKNPWQEEDFRCVELQYPSKSKKERFELKWPKNEKEDYKPMEDIIETIETICKWYFPTELSEKYLHVDTGYRRRFNHAWNVESVDEFIEVVQDFNTVLRGLIDDGSIRQELLSTSNLNLEWVKRILEQIYARTVSPKVETLRAYQNGSDNVYGELLPRFCSEIFRRTKLNHEHVFIDLGSGVGNVVLQAALEVGCDSWGVEMMKNPCDLADLQAKEFPARTGLWGLSAGSVNLIRGDFTDNPRIGEVLQRADIILVNNQAFTPQLNDALINMFLDLKEGAQIVSLKPFVPEGHKIAQRTVSSVVNHFVQKRFEYFSNSVSWTDQGGYYYIATKDRRPLDEFLRENKLQ